MARGRPRLERSAAEACHLSGQKRILAAAAAGVAPFIARHGGDAERIFAASGIDPGCLEDPVAPLSVASFVAMMEEAAAQTGEDNFGLWYGQQFLPEMQGLMGRVVLAAPTVEAALASMAAMFPYHQHAVECALEDAQGLARMTYRILDPTVVNRRQDAELTLGMILNLCRHGLGRAWVPERAEFEHPRPEGWREHERAFGAEVSFGCRTNALVFRRQGLERRMPGADLTRFAAERQRMVALAGTPREPSLLERVMSEIRAGLAEGPPHIELVATRLELPRWTLQRRLADAGLSFSAVVEQVRRDLAQLYLQQPHLPLSEIALALGYSELSAFSRAFTRWHGVPPLHARSGRAMAALPGSGRAAQAPVGPAVLEGDVEGSSGCGRVLI